MGLGNFFHKITIHASVLISCNLQSTKLKMSDISRFNLPSHKLRCYGNYCNDNCDHNCEFATRTTQCIVPHSCVCHICVHIHIHWYVVEESGAYTKVCFTIIPYFMHSNVVP